MKHLSKLLIVFLILLFSTTAFAQENYTVNGTAYVLKTEVEGPLTLLWNVIDGEYRYFAKKGDEIVELTNTRSDGKYQEEYKETLSQLISDNPVDVSNTNLTLPSLRAFINQYNKLADPGFVEKSMETKLETRLGVFAGMSNNNSTTNPDNVFAPFYGVEFEVTDNQMLRRHSILLQFRQTVVVPDYELYFSQFAFNYRFKFIHNEKLSLFAQAKLFTLTFSTRDENNFEELQELKSTAFNSPVGLGLGMDYKLGNGFLTLGVNDLVSPGIDNYGEFSIDLSLGYKIIL